MWLRPEVSFETGGVWDQGGLALTADGNPVRHVIYNFDRHSHSGL